MVGLTWLQAWLAQAPQSVMQITEIISLLAQGPISTVGRDWIKDVCVSPPAADQLMWGLS
jgi:hypothetical protein